MNGRSWALALFGASLMACSSTDSGAPSFEDGGADVAAATPEGGDNDAEPVTATQTVGASGGTVTVQGLALTVPAGALPGDTRIAIAPSAAPVPSGYAALSPLYDFGPSGTVFLQPVTVDFEIVTAGANPTVYWSNASGGYDALATKITGTTASASVTHFSSGFVGVGPEGSDGGLDATTSEDSGGAAVDATTNEDSGAAGEDVSTSDSGGAGMDATTTSDDSGLIVDAAPTPDSAPATDAESADAGQGAGDGGADSGAFVDSGSLDAGAPGIRVTIDGTPTTFGANVVATTNGNSVWTIQGDTNSSGTRWHLQLVYISIGSPTKTCTAGSSYPQITYTEYLNGALYSVFQSQGTCTVTVGNTPTMADAGEQASGTFSGTVALLQDGGAVDGGASHVLTNGTYDGAY